MAPKKIKKIDIQENKRAERLRELFKDVEAGVKEIVDPLIDDVIFLEARLEELKALPQIKINPDNPVQQKATVAAKQYKEMLQQYTNCIKVLTGILRKDSGEDESPLRAYLNSRMRDE